MKKILFATVVLSSALLVSCGTATNTNVNAGATVTGTGVDMSGAAPSTHVQGNPNAKAVLVEFSDLQCPACKNAEPSVKSIVDEFGGNLRFEYRYFPLTTIHKNSLLAAHAAEAAGLQGKFWEMKTQMFNTQDDWAESDNAMDTFKAYAKDLGLDVAKFEQDTNSAAVQSTVANDIALGNQIGVNATPSFYLNGKLLRPKSFDDFNAIVREAVLNQ